MRILKIRTIRKTKDGKFVGKISFVIGSKEQFSSGKRKAIAKAERKDYDAIHN